MRTKAETAKIKDLFTAILLRYTTFKQQSKI